MTLKSEKTLYFYIIIMQNKKILKKIQKKLCKNKNKEKFVLFDYYKQELEDLDSPADWAKEEASRMYTRQN